jgi:thioester reductase-like protein
VGDERSAACDPDYFVWRFLLSCIKVGCTPAVEMNLYLTPADYIARALVYLSTRPDSIGKTFHLFNHHQVRLADAVAAARSLGYRIESVSTTEWAQALASFPGALEHLPLSPYMLLIPAGRHAELHTHTELATFDQGNAIEGLSGSGISCPRVDRARLCAYFEYFIRTGALEPPVTRVAAARAREVIDTGTRHG